MNLISNTCQLTALLPCRLSGLVVDIFGDLAVIASSAAWVEKYKPHIEACIGRIDEINHLKWRPAIEILKEEGMDASDLKDVHPSTCPQRTKVKGFLQILQTEDLDIFTYPQHINSQSYMASCRMKDACI